MTRYKVVHNGMQIQFFDEASQVYNFIDSTLFKNLSPLLVCNYKLEKGLYLMVYKYYTEYMEMFLVYDLNVRDSED